MTVIINHPYSNDYVKAKVFVSGTIADPKIELEYRHEGMTWGRTITKEQAHSLGITTDSQPFKQLIACQA